MISKSDCLLLLGEMQSNGVDTGKITEELIQSKDLINAVKFINEHRELDVTRFYEKIRKSYNNRRSNLYINIVKEIEDTNEVLTTLSALQTQILLFARGVEDKQMFLRHARAVEISMVLNNYFKTYDITQCIKLLKLIKCDLKVLEYINKG